MYAVQQTQPKADKRTIAGSESARSTPSIESESKSTLLNRATNLAGREAGA